MTSKRMLAVCRCCQCFGCDQNLVGARAAQGAGQDDATRVGRRQCEAVREAVRRGDVTQGLVATDAVDSTVLQVRLGVTTTLRTVAQCCSSAVAAGVNRLRHIAAGVIDPTSCFVAQDPRLLFQLKKQELMELLRRSQSPADALGELRTWV
jgi:hypothetical protein